MTSSDDDDLDQQQIPPRPKDPLGGTIWDVTYGAGKKADPFMKAARKFGDVNAVKDEISQNMITITELNIVLKELLVVSRELNENLKIINKMLNSKEE